MTIDQADAAELLGSLSSLLRATRSLSRSHEMGAAGTPLGVLKALRSGDARPGDLAGVLHVAPSVISRAVAPLEAAGLVGRTADPADGRASLLTLTPAGRDRLQQLQAGYVEEIAHLLSDWTAEETRRLSELIRRMERSLTDPATVDAQQRLLSAALTPAPEPVHHSRKPVSL